MHSLVRFSLFAIFYICVHHGSNYVLVCGNQVPNYVLVCGNWNKNAKKSILNVWGRRVGDAAGERRPPKAAQIKHVPQTFNPARFGGRFGGRGWRCSEIARNAFSCAQFIYSGRWSIDRLDLFCDCCVLLINKNFWMAFLVYWRHMVASGLSSSMHTIQAIVYRQILVYSHAA